MPRTFRRAFSNAVPGNAIILAENNGQLTGVIASWQFSALTGAGDPGAGFLRFNHVTPGSVTSIRFDNLDAQDNDLGAWLSSLTVGSQLVLRSANGPAQFAIYTVVSVTDSTGYRTVVVTWLAGTPAFLNGEALAVQAALKGIGDAGSNGVDGKFSGTEVIKTAAYTAQAGDSGKTIILNKASTDTLSFAAAATLGATWMVFVKNINAGQWTLDPDGSETIDGATTASLAQNESVVVASNGSELRTFFRGSAAFTAFTAASAAGPASLDFAEDTDNGSNKVTLRAPAAVALNRTFILPDADLTLSANVQGAGRFGLDDQGGLFIYEAIAAAAAGYGVASRAQANFAYTGGSPGTVNTTLATLTTAGAGVADFVWGHVSILYNDAAAGENTAGYYQGIKQSTGKTWGLVAEAMDSTAVADPGSGATLVGIEVDLDANGTDANNSRLGAHIVVRRYNGGGTDVEAAAGLRLGANDSHALFKKGIEFFAGSKYGIGVDFTGALLSSDKAIQLNDGHKIALDTAGAALLSYASSAPQIAVADAVTNVVSTGLRLSHASSGTVAASFGVALAAELENASGSLVDAGALGFSWSVATASSERTNLNVNLRNGSGSVAQVARFDGRGRFGIGVNPAVALDVAGSGDTQMRLVDASSVDFRLSASNGSATGFIGTWSNHLVIFYTNFVERLRLGADVTSNAGAVIISGNLSLGAPVTKTADFTLAATENSIVNNKTGSACVVTLPAASAWPGRRVRFKTIQAQAINSASSNVVPLAGGSAGTAVVTGTAGRWLELESDGTNWIAMAGVP